MALTFDDVRSPHTDALLEALDDHDVRGAFFVRGATAMAELETVRRIHAAGHVVGGAGWDRVLTGLSAGDVKDDVARANAALEEITGEPVRHVRPMGGHYDLMVTAALDDMGLACWLWTRYPRVVDGELDFAEALEATLGELVPGSVIAIDGGADARRSAELLPMLIEGCRAQGYRFATLDPFAIIPVVGSSRPRPTILTPVRPAIEERPSLRSVL